MHKYPFTVYISYICIWAADRDHFYLRARLPPCSPAWVQLRFRSRSLPNEEVPLCCSHPSRLDLAKRCAAWLLPASPASPSPLAFRLSGSSQPRQFCCASSLALWFRQSSDPVLWPSLYKNNSSSSATWVDCEDSCLQEQTAPLRHGRWAGVGKRRTVLGGSSSSLLQSSLSSSPVERGHLSKPVMMHLEKNLVWSWKAAS